MRIKFQILLLIIIILFNSPVSGSTGDASVSPSVASEVPNLSDDRGYYVIHWPVNGDYTVFIDGQFAGKLENNSLAVPLIRSDDPLDYRYSIVFENLTVFSDTLPVIPIGEIHDIYPNLIQITPPDSLSGETNTTYTIHWPEDGAEVYIDGHSKGFIRNSQCRIDIPEGSARPKKITILPLTSGYEKGPFTIEVPVPKGGQLDYYPYWEISFNEGPAINKNSGNLSVSLNSSLPTWIDHLGFGGVVVSCSGNGQYVVAGSDMGIVRFYDSSGDVLWTYQIPGEPVGNVKVSEDANLVTAGYYYSYPNPKKTGGRIMQFDRNGTLIWKYESDETLRAMDVSDDGRYIYASQNNELFILDNRGSILESRTMQGPVGSLAVSGDGLFCLAAGYRDTFGSLSLVNRTAAILFTVPEGRRYSGIGISYNGNVIAATDDYNLTVYSPDGAPLWNFTSGSRVRSVAVSATGDCITVGSQSSLRVFNHTGSIEWSYEDSKPQSHSSNSWVNSISISKDGQNILAGISDEIVLFNKLGAVLWQYSGPERIWEVSSTDNGGFFAASTQRDIFYFNRAGNPNVESSEERLNNSPGLSPFDNGPVQNATPSHPSPVSCLIPITVVGFAVLIRNLRNKR